MAGVNFGLEKKKTDSEKLGSLKPQNFRCEKLLSKWLPPIFF